MLESLRRHLPHSTPSLYSSQTMITDLLSREEWADEVRERIKQTIAENGLSAELVGRLRASFTNNVTRKRSVQPYLDATYSLRKVSYSVNNQTNFHQIDIDSEIYMHNFKEQERHTMSVTAGRLIDEIASGSSAYPEAARATSDTAQLTSIEPLTEAASTPSMLVSLVTGMQYVCDYLQHDLPGFPAMSMELRQSLLEQSESDMKSVFTMESLHDDAIHWDSGVKWWTYHPLTNELCLAVPFTVVDTKGGTKRKILSLDCPMTNLTETQRSPAGSRVYA